MATEKLNKTEFVAVMRSARELVETGKASTGCPRCGGKIRVEIDGTILCEKSKCFKLKGRGI